MSLTTEEQQQLVSLLSKLEPGFYPPEIFFALAALAVTVTYTIVPLYRDKETVQVWLSERESDDPHWAGQLQTPGKVILPTDSDITATHDRLVSSEMSGLTFNDVHFCGYVFDEIPRGKEVALINYVEVTEPPAVGRLYDVTTLPDNLIATEHKRIAMATEMFGKSSEK